MFKLKTKDVNIVQIIVFE